ncbi:hypothetical protein AZE42_11863 [Rhizopogon vesiculosus]|uniref:Cytochrome P450 n=1 Tax=Rhizopogon vesiculosus TaxID=180088 RepID=A0A1J8QE29_9AGAM|nr:hypothetical protein AZE42_11863 [Rhizopogon vesiculosus]
MILFPEVQEKARAEIDSVIGKDRLPTFGDRDSLPYIEAIICETMRWHSPLPLGVPHTTTTDDVYRGFRIPKGTTNIYRTHNDWRYHAIVSTQNISTRDATSSQQVRSRLMQGCQGVLFLGSEEGYVPDGFWRRVCCG